MTTNACDLAALRLQAAALEGDSTKILLAAERYATAVHAERAAAPRRWARPGRDDRKSISVVLHGSLWLARWHGTDRQASTPGDQVDAMRAAIAVCVNEAIAEVSRDLGESLLAQPWVEVADNGFRLDAEQIIQFLDPAAGATCH